jgi:hypothetical protein
MPPFYTVAYEGVMAVRAVGNLVSLADQDFKTRTADRMSQQNASGPAQSATEAFTGVHSLTWTPGPTAWPPCSPAFAGTPCVASSCVQAPAVGPSGHCQYLWRRHHPQRRRPGGPAQVPELAVAEQRMLRRGLRGVSGRSADAASFDVDKMCHR